MVGGLRRRLAGLHADHRRIALGAARVAFFLLLGKVVGAFKEMAVAYRYGVSDVVDAYQFTLTLANWLPVTLVGACSVVLIPALVRSRRLPGAAHGRFLRELQGVALVLGAAVALVLLAVWPAVVPWVGGGLSGPVREMSTLLILGFAPAALFTIWTGLSAARLRAHERHVNTLLDSMPALVILVWVLASPAGGLWPLLWGTLVGYALQAILLAAFAARADGHPGGALLGRQAPQWSTLAAAAGIMLVGQLAMSLVGPIDQYTAARLGDNANAILGYATRLLSLVLGIGAASVGRAALPVLADIQGRGDPAHARRMALRWSGGMLAVGALVVLAGWWLAPWGVGLLFERGAFTAHDTQVVAEVLRWGLLQLPFYFGVLILVQLLASQNRYGLMATIAVLNFLVKAAMNHVLAPIMGPSGIMLATALMYASSYACYLCLALRRPAETSGGNA
ncbi:murein biosynthesis integral membrane protein MurJ [Castellaniella sp. S9]|uniref:murein biosynthesis integral membrane protein MurJ n=1 Tax=Castellaniella sp. S9 TaxID=2993652 RepID=UPI0022B2B220|nr:lipid II flippase MurJ [Castellaniella sp. S9]